jgi:hypothetical protein
LREASLLRINHWQILQQALRWVLVAMVLAGCTTNPTITVNPTAPSATALVTIAPVVIAGISVQAQLAQRSDSYSLDLQQTYTPSSPNDDCLFVRAAINTRTPEAALQWPVTLIDEHGRSSKPVQTTTAMDEMGVGNVIGWLFTVARGSHSFTLHFADGQSLQLDNLVTIAPATTPVVGSSGLLDNGKATAAQTNPIVLHSTATASIPAACVSALQAHPSVVCLASDTGDALGGGKVKIITPQELAFDITVSGHYLDVSLGEGASSWQMQFAPPAGAPLRAGLYSPADSLSPATANALISVYGNGFSCDSNQAVGDFEISDLIYQPDDPNVLTLALSFVFHCQGTEPALRGVIHLNQATTP